MGEGRGAGRRPAGLSVGVAGTAKNTGKTTTLMGAMRECQGRGRLVRLTSIGFDGEDLDNVTGLPKPRIYCDTGTMFATASGCVKAGTARVRLVARTSIETALGRVVIGVVEREGLVVLAGPNKTQDLEDLLQTMAGVDHRPGVTLVDGAFGRMAPMSVVDAVVLATGAARNPSIGILAAETRDIAQLFDIPRLTPGVAGLERPKGGFRLVGGRTGELPEEGLLAPVEPPGGRERVEYIEAPGAVSPPALVALADALGPRLEGAMVVFQSPASLLVSGDPTAAAGAVTRLRSLGANVWVRRRPELLGITVNPYFPVRVSAGAYEARFVDSAELLRQLRRDVARPVWDVVKEGTGGLGDAIESMVTRGGTEGVESQGKEGIPDEALPCRDGVDRRPEAGDH